MDIKQAAASVLVGVAMLCTAGAARANVMGPNLIANGGFESGLAGWVPTNFLLEGYDYGIDGDAHGGASAFYGGAVGTIGLLSQSFATTPGRRYELTYWRSSNGFLPNEFTVAVGGSSRVDESDLVLQGYGRGTFDFVATSALTKLDFGFQNDSGLFHLDDVSVLIVPEPASLALMGIGIAALARRRRRAA